MADIKNENKNVEKEKVEMVFTPDELVVYAASLQEDEMVKYVEEHELKMMFGSVKRDVLRALQAKLEEREKNKVGAQPTR